MKKLSLVLALICMLSLFAACAPQADRDVSSAASVKTESVKTIDINIDDIVGRDLVLRVHETNIKELIAFDTANGGAFEGYANLEEMQMRDADISSPVTMKKITDADVIKELKEKLNLESWQLVEYDLNDTAKGVLYLDYNIHINVEGESKDVNYISICTNEACRYYNAPQDTYDYIKSLCTISK